MLERKGHETAMTTMTTIGTSCVDHQLIANDIGTDNNIFINTQEYEIEREGINMFKISWLTCTPWAYNVHIEVQSTGSGNGASHNGGPPEIDILVGSNSLYKCHSHSHYTHVYWKLLLDIHEL